MEPDAVFTSLGPPSSIDAVLAEPGEVFPGHTALKDEVTFVLEMLLFSFGDNGGGCENGIHGGPC